MKIYRTDIVIALTSPLLLGILYQLKQGEVKNILLLGIIFLILLCEILFLYEEEASNKKNRYRYIYLLIYVVLILAWLFLADSLIYVIVLCMMLWLFFLFKEDFLKHDTGRAIAFFASIIFTLTWLFSEALTPGASALSAIIAVTGIILRIISKISLWRNFSSSLRIKSSHKLITTGVYTYIRHPSYLGMLLIVTGITFWLPFIAQVIIVTISTYIVKIRIVKEEKMLREHFGNNYIMYQENSKKLIPFIY